MAVSALIMQTKNISVNDQTVLVVEDKLKHSNNLATSDAIITDIENNGIFRSSVQIPEDFSITDGASYSILKVDGGHIKTKNFDSSEVPETKQLKADVFDISDGKNNSILRIENGHIRTKNFDSSNISIQTGRRKLRHIIGYGQSLMAGSYSGNPVTISQPYDNIKMFTGGVRPYDMFGLASNQHTYVHRTGSPSYGELFLTPESSLSDYSNQMIGEAFMDLIPAVERRPSYKQDSSHTGFSYVYDTTGTYTNEHGNGETPLTAFAIEMNNAVSGGNTNYHFDYDFLVTCAAYGSAHYFSLLPYDRGGTIHGASGHNSNMNYFEVLMLSVVKAKQYADSHNMDYSVDYLLYFEESVDHADNSNIAMTRMLQLFNIVNKRVRAITHQRNDIIFILHCSNLTNGLLTLGTVNACIRTGEVELSAADEELIQSYINNDIRPISYDCVYAGYASYAYNFVADYGHHTSGAQKEIGIQIASNVAHNRKQPLYAKKIIVKNNIIYIECDVPCPPLVIDTELPIPASTMETITTRKDKYGFLLLDANTPVDKITNVEIIESDIIKITCSESPVGLTLSYAYLTADAPNGVDMRYGCIRDSNTSSLSNHVYNWMFTFYQNL